MKKFVSSAVMLSLVSVMLFGLVGCGQKEQPPVQQPPVVEQPVVTDEPEVLEDTGEQPHQIGLAEIVNTLKYNLGENYLPNFVISEEDFNMMTGLTSDMYEEFYAEMPMIGTQADKLFVVRATDVAAVEAAFNAYKTAQIEDAMQYPMNKVKVEKAVVAVYEDFVFYYILGGYSEMIQDDTKTPEELEALQTQAEEDWAIKCNEEVGALLEGLFTAGYDDTITDFYGEMMAAMEEVTEPAEGEVTEPVEGEATEAVEGEATEVTEPVEGEVTEPVEGEATETAEPAVEGETTEVTEPVEGEATETTETATDFE